MNDNYCIKCIEFIDHLLVSLPLKKSKLEKLFNLTLDVTDNPSNPYYDIFQFKTAEYQEVEARLKKSDDKGLIIFTLKEPVKIGAIQKKYGGRPEISANTPANPNQMTYSYEIGNVKLSFESNAGNMDEVRMIVVEWV